MHFDTLAIQPFLPDERIQGEFPAMHRLQKRFGATLIPWLNDSCSACLVLHQWGVQPAQTLWAHPLNGVRMQGDVVPLLSIGSSLLPDQFQAAEYHFLCPGLTQQLKLFCLALTQLTQRHSLEQWRFTRLFFLLTPTHSVQYRVIKVTEIADVRLPIRLALKGNISLLMD